MYNKPTSASVKSMQTLKSGQETGSNRFFQQQQMLFRCCKKGGERSDEKERGPRLEMGSRKKSFLRKKQTSSWIFVKKI
jgi:hypothetical protein